MRAQDGIHRVLHFDIVIGSTLCLIRKLPRLKVAPTPSGVVPVVVRPAFPRGRQGAPLAPPAGFAQVPASLRRGKNQERRVACAGRGPSPSVQKKGREKRKQKKSGRSVPSQSPSSPRSPGIGAVPVDSAWETTRGSSDVVSKPKPAAARRLAVPRQPIASEHCLAWPGARRKLPRNQRADQRRSVAQDPAG